MTPRELAGILWRFAYDIRAAAPNHPEAEYAAIAADEAAMKVAADNGFTHDDLWSADPSKFARGVDDSYGVDYELLC